MKKIVTSALLVFVLASLAYLMFQEGGAGSATQTTQATPPEGAVAQGTATDRPVPHRLVAYYFHGQKRCNTCRTIQALSQEAVEAGFPEALMAGLLEFRDVNTDEPGNDHFVTDYDLTGSSLVLVDQKDGRAVRHKTLSKTWDLFADRPAFLAYVQSEIRPWLEAP